MASYRWYQHFDKRLSPEQKIKECIAAYVNRYHAAPRVVYANPEQVVTIDGVEVKPRIETLINTFWLGEE